MVKVCGVRAAAAARLCVELGATHLGCVLTPGARRAATPEQVRAVVEAAEDLAQVVLVFQHSASTSEVVDACVATGAQHVQVRGHDEAFCRHLEEEGLGVWRAHLLDRARPRLPRGIPTPTRTSPVLFDLGGPDDQGPCLWPRLVAPLPPFALLRGGIGPDQVAAVLTRRPYGIDVTAAVERAPAELDRAAVERLFAAVLGAGEQDQAGS